MKLQTKIFLGLGVGIAVGVASRLAGAEWLPPRLISLEPLGTAFIQLVTMVVVPLVVASVFVGVTSLGDVRRLGAIGGRTLSYFLITTLIGACLGLVVALAMGFAPDPTVSTAAGARLDATPSLASTLLAMVPQNPVAAAARTDLLPLI